MGKVERGVGPMQDRQRGCKLQKTDAAAREESHSQRVFLNTLRECRDASRFKRKSSPGGERLVQCNVGRSVNVRKRKRAACYTKFFW